MMWNESDFMGIQSIVTNPRSIWTPDLSLINSHNLYSLTRDNRFPIIVKSNGQILFTPAGTVSAQCELDITYFPFDQQLCKLRFESWVYDIEMLKLIGVNFTLHPQHFVSNPQWTVLETFTSTGNAVYEDFIFSKVELYLLLERKSTFYILYCV